MLKISLVIFLISVFVFSAGHKKKDDVYRIGVGKADITGPAAEVTMMGYGQFNQRTTGIHTRLYSRSFIIDDGSSRVLFISLDACMTSQMIYMQVIKKLKQKYGDIYTEKNVCISSTHTHSAPGGYIQYALYSLPSLGFVRETYDSMMKGILKSIEMAHNNAKEGYILWNEGDLYDASINRSPTSYSQNPAEERAKYNSNVDTKMTLLKFVDKNGAAFGMINWFPVHATSINNTNTLISSDNKGYASFLFEKKMKCNTSEQTQFVAAFAQSHEGDVSPNTKGPRCIDTGLPCDADTSSCDGDNMKCIAFGPGKDMYESAKIIGRKHYEKAKELFKAANTKIFGSVSYVQQYVDMSNVEVKLNDTTYVKTCKPAMGTAFAAGTTDGPGSASFKQGEGQLNMFWRLITTIMTHPSKEIIRCQRPKTVFIPGGEMNFPYAWQPSILPIQILKIGQLQILAVPAEFTTMAGRRLINAVKKITDKCFSTNNVVVIAGLSNSYSSYVATYEEYQVQRYEGASTLYGPYTLQAYIQEFEKLAKSLCTGEELPDGPTPPDMLRVQMSFLSSTGRDVPHKGKQFGDVLEDANESYKLGDAVTVTFVSSNPRNNPMLGDSFLTVERQEPKTGNWTTVARDEDWETRYIWKKNDEGHSEATIVWDIPTKATLGKYRIRHYGYSKSSKTSPFQGTSRSFVISK